MLWSHNGTGDDIFSIPPTVKKVRITATYAGNFTYFTVECDDATLVEEAIGTEVTPRPDYNGVRRVPAGCKEIETTGHGVVWSFTEVR